MVVKKVKYEKEFLSRKSEPNSQTGNFSQITSKEDDSLRYEIQQKFDFRGTNGMGFDGILIYNYDVIGNPNVPINTKENIKYKTTYNIKKAGILENISKNCELENFLLEKGFKPIED